jgi:hypothetical protein
MSDLERVKILKNQLKRLDCEPVPAWQRSIHEVARLAIEAELTAVGRRLSARSYAILDGGIGYGMATFGLAASGQQTELDAA